MRDSARLSIAARCLLHLGLLIVTIENPAGPTTARRCHNSKKHTHSPLPARKSSFILLGFLIHRQSPCGLDEQT